MRVLLSGGVVYRDGRLRREDILMDGNRILTIGPNLSSYGKDLTIHCSTKVVVPGFVDVHVHLREPGFFMKENLRSGTLAAAAGGYTTVCAMPNLNPVPDSREHLDAQLALIREKAVVKVLPYGSITVGQQGQELADLTAMASDVAGFTDDGHGVQRDAMMRAAMMAAKALGKGIFAHCEVDELLLGGYIHEGTYAKAHGHAGISSESEWKQIERDLGLVRETGCKYHALHVSTLEGVDLIRKAKAEGLPVTCETAPHYLALCEEDLQEDGFFKMNPPLRSAADRDALILGVRDGTIDVIATDHAPHTMEEKSRGLKDSLMGIVGLETALPVLYTRLVLRGLLPLERLFALLCDAPRALLGQAPGLRVGGPADIAVLDLEMPYQIDASRFASMGRNTPFDGWSVRGRCVRTFVEGKTIWECAEGSPRTCVKVPM